MNPPPDLSAASDQDVVALARQQREEACRKLLRRYQRPVYALIHRAVRDHEVARDLTQEAFIKAFHALLSHPPKRNVSAWMLQIAHHTAVDYLRRKELTPLPLDDEAEITPPSGQIKRTARGVAEWSDSTPARTVNARTLGPAIEQAITRLRPEYRECFMLRVVEERSYEDIAEILDLPVGTVATYLHRARKELQQMLGPLRDASPPDSTATPA